MFVLINHQFKKNYHIASTCCDELFGFPFPAAYSRTPSPPPYYFWIFFMIIILGGFASTCCDET